MASTTGARTVLNIDARFNNQILGRGVEYRVAENDDESAMQAKEATDWIVSEQDSLSFGFSPRARWIRFSLHNLSEETRDILIELSNPYLDYIDVYTITSKSEIAGHVTLGDQFPAITRPILHANFLAPINLPSKSQQLILIRVKTVSTARIPIQVWDEQHYVGANYKRTLIQSLLYGALVAIAIYHLMLFFSIKEKAYLYYGASVLGMLCIVFSLDGIPTAILWSNSIRVGDYFIMLGICGTIACTALFSRVVLDLYEFPMLNRIMQILFVIALALWVGTFVAPYHIVLKLGLFMALVHAVVLIGVYSIRVVHGYSPAKYAASAVIFAAIGIIITVLTSVGKIPSHPLGANAAGIGTVLSVLFYSLALSNRMNIDRALREEAQRNLIEDLDQKVRERSDELQKANGELLQASITDGLTGLMNRRYFDEVFLSEYRRAFRQKQPISVLMLDIDFFKRLNDNYGHQFGDLCLQEVAKRIQQSLNRPPDICARYGGEEFIIVLPNTPLEGAVRVAEMINKKIGATPVCDDENSVLVTISIGVSVCVPEQASNNEGLMKQADMYLYKAKENGRNQVAYS